MKRKMWALVLLGCGGCGHEESRLPTPSLEASASAWPALDEKVAPLEEEENPWENAAWMPPVEGEMSGVGGYPSDDSAAGGQGSGSGGVSGGDGDITASGGEAIADEPVPLDRWLSLYEEGEGSIKRLGVAGEPGTSPAPCVVEVYANGGTSPWRRVQIPDVLPDAGEIRFCSEAGWEPGCTQEMNGSLYNGNDALVLRCGEVVFDSLGTVGQDPGAAWSVETLAGLVRTEGQRLLRCDDYRDLDPGDPTTLEGWVSQGTRDEASARASCVFPNAGEGGAGGTTL